MSAAAIRKDLAFIVCIVLVALWGLQTFFAGGLFETHDGRLHIARLFWFDEEIRSGQFPVRWSETANHSYGYPLFIFYYPLFYLLAELVHLAGFNLVDAMKLVTAGSFLLSGIAAYFWLKTFGGRWPALAGAVIFLLSPYRLELLFVMGRWAESFAFLPLVLTLWATGKFGETKERKYLFLGGLFLALLILSHNAVALLTVPIILLWILTSLLGSAGWRRRGNPVVVPLKLLLWGLILSAWFWIPALAESRYTLQGQNPVYDFRQNFPSFKSYLYYPWGYGFSLTGEPNGVSPMVGLGQLAAVGLGIAILGGIIVQGLSPRESPPGRVLGILIFGLIGAGTIFFMMNSASSPVWEKLPLIKSVQFPGRLNVVLLTMIAVTVAGALQILSGRRKIQAGLAIFLIGFTVYANRNYLRAGVPDRFFDQDVIGVYWFRFGTGDSSHESTPVWSRPLPAEWEDKVTAVTEGTEISAISLLSRHYSFTVEAPEGGGVISVNTVYYPGWRARIDDEELKLIIPDKERNLDGLIRFTIPQGSHKVEVWFGETPLRLTADLVSLVGGILWLGIVAKRGGKPSEPNKRRGD